MVLSCMMRMNERFGTSLISGVLTGSKNKKILDWGFDRLSTYGLMKDQSQKEVGLFIDYLISEGIIQVEGGSFPVLKVSSKGKEVLMGERAVSRKVQPTVSAIIPKEDGLFQTLRALRKSIAESEGVPPFVIFSDKALQDMCVKLPKTSEEFLQVSGVGESKKDRYGEMFIEEISAFLEENPTHQVETVKPEPARKVNHSDTASYLISYALFKDHKGIKEIAKERGMSTATIENHIIRTYQEGILDDWSILFTDEEESLIEEAVSKAGTDLLKPIKEELPKDISYFQIKGYLVKSGQSS